MIKFREIAKGVSFLLCLGFLMHTSSAWAKGIADVTSDSAYANCPSAVNEVMRYNSYGECAAEKGAVTSAQSALDSACNMYKNIKSEYKKCTSGGMEKSKTLLATLNKAKDEAKVCEGKLKEYLSNAESYLKACKKATKAQSKADTKAAEAAEAAQAAELANNLMQSAEANYHAAEAKCEAGDANACDKLDEAYKAYENAAKAAGKAAKKSNSAQSSADKASTKATKANSKTCLEGMIWDEELQMCINDIPAVVVTPDANNLDVDAGDMGADTGDEALNSQTQLAKQTQEAKDNATGNNSARCTNVEKGGFGIFNYLACKITTVVADVRAIVYILAGFGMIAFAYGAIIGKINFKQLANIGIGLFILSMTTSFIEYFVFNDGTSRLQYGDYLPNGNHAQFNTVTADCSSDPSLCPDAKLAGLKDAASASKGSFSIKDLKGSISSVKDAIKTGVNMYKTAKNAVETTGKAVQNIGNAIKNGGDITDVVNTIVSNVNNVAATAKMTAGQMVSGYSSISGDIQNAGMTNEQREYKANLENEYNTLKGKCDTGNCSANELAALNKLATDVEAGKTKGQKWAESDGKGGGATILAGIGNVANTTQKAAGVTNNVAKAQNEGEALGNEVGGGTLGALLGAGYAATEAFSSGSDAYEAAQKDGNFDYRSEQKKAADAEAEAKADCSKNGWNWIDGKCVDPNAEAKAKAKAEAEAKAKAEAEAKAKAEEAKRQECIEVYRGQIENGVCKRCAGAGRGYVWGKDENGKETCVKQ